MLCVSTDGGARVFETSPLRTTDQVEVDAIAGLMYCSVTAALNTPIISGPCVVSNFYPKNAFPAVDTKVQLTNFPRPPYQVGNLESCQRQQ